MKYKSLDDFLNAWHNAPDAMNVVNKGIDLNKAQEMLSSKIHGADRTHLRYYHRRLISLINAVALDINLFKDPDSGYFLVNEESVEDFFTYLLQIPDEQSSLICNGKFQRLSPEVLIYMRMRIISVMQGLHCSDDRIKEQITRFMARTGCPRAAYDEVVVETSRMIAAHIQPGIEYHFWTPDSGEIPPHTPFTDSEWDGIMDAMQEDYTQLKAQFIERWKKRIKDLSQKYDLPNDSPSQS